MRASGFLITLACGGLLAALSACGTTPPATPSGRQISAFYPPASHVPNLAAEFETTRRHDDGDARGPDARVVWRFWREDRQIVTERPQLALGELWLRDGRTVIHRKLYHRERRAIEFQDDDLRMMKGLPSWQKLSLLVDAQLLAQLRSSGQTLADGAPIRDYRGTLNQTEWHIVMREDLGLPMLIERKLPGLSERTELLRAYPPAAAPWRPTPANGYEIIDFADLGDKEYDPFVRRVQQQMGHAH